MQRKSPVLLATILLGVLALGATAFLLLGPKPGPSGPAPGTAQAAVPTPTPAARWVASRDIPPRTLILPQMMRKDFAPGAIPTGALTSLDEVRGQITKEPIGAGETVLLSSFTPRIKRAVDANIVIPAGYRGVAIWVDPDQTAAGLVDVGDRIDVIATHKMSYEKQARQYVVGASNFTTGRTIAQNLLVLGVNKSINAVAPTPTPPPGAAPAGAPAPPPPPTPAPPTAPSGNRTRVLVAATPDIAARLVAANDQGLLNVTIRNPADGDAGLVPEAREYPTRLFTAAREATAGAGGSGNKDGRGNGGSNSGNTSGSRRRRVEPLMPEMGPMPSLPSTNPPAADPLITPANPGTSVPRPNNMGNTGMGGNGMGGTGMSAPDAPTTREITVIRGTEKTRVIVPQR